jgi:hypothetical protein
MIGLDSATLHAKPRQTPRLLVKLTVTTEGPRPGAIGITFSGAPAEGLLAGRLQVGVAGICCPLETTLWE